MRINSVWAGVFCVRGGVFGAPSLIAEKPHVSKSNILCGFSKHMWLFKEGCMQEPPGFCNYRISPPLPRDPVTTQAAANRPGC